MVVPLAVRLMAAVAGGLLVLAAWAEMAVRTIWRVRCLTVRDVRGD